MIQKEAFGYAIINHTWQQRAKMLHDELLKFI